MPPGVAVTLERGTMCTDLDLIVSSAALAPQPFDLDHISYYDMLVIVALVIKLRVIAPSFGSTTFRWGA